MDTSIPEFSAVWKPWSLNTSLYFPGGEIDKPVDALIIGHLGVNSAQHIWTGKLDGDSGKDGPSSSETTPVIFP